MSNIDRLSLGTDPGNLISTLPHLLGFHPIDSVVVLALKDDAVQFVARTDVPEPGQRQAVAEQLADLPAMRGIDKVIFVVVMPATSAVDPPGRRLVNTMRRAFKNVGIEVTHRLWTSATQAGQPWRCYDTPDCRGLLPEPDASLVAAKLAFSGHRTHPNRQSLAEEFALEDAAAADRRGRLLADDSTATMSTDHALGLVRGAIERTAKGDPPSSDAEIVQLIQALSAPGMGDQCVVFGIGRQAQASEDLWRTLTRAVPAPYRAEPAALLATTTYLRGNGVLARIALDVALDAEPGHLKADLLRQALDGGITPQQLQAMVAGITVNPAATSPPDDQSAQT